MTVKKLIHKLCDRRGYIVRDFSQAIGYKSKSTVTAYLNKYGENGMRLRVGMLIK